ncbi:MAG TPA: hypothetical protein VNE39_11770 [Planctomycetota bacterium]|nr:hypothetical protein [Planctomycetota bacterium]
MDAEGVNQVIDKVSGELAKLQGPAGEAWAVLVTQYQRAAVAYIVMGCVVSAVLAILCWRLIAECRVALAAFRKRSEGDRNAEPTVPVVLGVLAALAGLGAIIVPCATIAVNIGPAVAPTWFVAKALLS